MELIQLNPMIIALVPLVIAVVQVFKLTGLPSRLAPISALILGVIFVLLVFPLATVGLSVVAGLVVGTMAAGTYSGMKATFAPSAA